MVRSAPRASDRPSRQSGPLEPILHQMPMTISSFAARVLGASSTLWLLIPASAQLTVNNTITVQDLVQDVLLGGGVTASNITFNGQPGNLANIQIGRFDGTNCNVGLPNGILLSSGDVHVALGPNDDGASTDPAGGIGGPNDPDLDQASSATTFDRAVLEFDFVPAGDSLRFRYVFASEEYLEYVDAGFNDVFGFFLSGPGISGPYSNNATNIALVPGTTQPVSIDNVNTGTNPGYYVDNGDGFTAPYDSDPHYIQFDGFTTVLVARAAVQCGQPYHIKIAIADAGDPVLDSGVFLEAGSFSSPNAVQLDLVTASSDGTLTEGCSNATFTVSRPGTQGDLDVAVVVSGTATNGVDYTQIPSTITIPDGQQSVSLPVDAFEDGQAEGVEEMVLTATYVNACGQTATSTASIPINDYVPIQITAPDQTLHCDMDSVLLSASVTGGFGDLALHWSTGSTQPTTQVYAMIDHAFTLAVTDACARTAQADVHVYSGCELVVPNVFSPNGDGQNDRFEIKGIEGVGNTVQIFNRWGQKVFTATNYRNTWSASGLPDGTYYYVVTADTEPQPLTGHLTILSNGRKR